MVSPEDLTKMLYALAAVVAAVSSTGSWMSNCILAKRNAQAIKESKDVSSSNSDKLDVLTNHTNGLASRNEAIARKLGVEEGKASEKANPTP